MKLLKFTQTLLPVACLTGLISCYPVAPLDPNDQFYKPSGLKTQAELDAAAKKRAEAANNKLTALERSKERLEKQERDRLEKERREVMGLPPLKTKPTKEKVDIPNVKKPVKVNPIVIKYGIPVPGKKGFVKNPFTGNEVDARGIPSGTRIRDPFDPNPAHVFRTP